MRNRLGFLFLSNLIVWGTANGLTPLLPVNASRLGATASITGLYMAIAYLAMAAGTLSTPFLWRKLGGPQWLLTGGSLLAAIVFVVAGQATTIALLIVATSVTWMACGLVSATLGLVMGALADPEHRGRIFGWMSLAVPTGALVGGLTFGVLVKHGGFEVMFGALGVAWLALPWLGERAARGVEQCPHGVGKCDETPVERPKSAAFYVIVATIGLLSVAVFVGRLGVSYTMQTLYYAPEQIAQAAALGALLALPAIPWLGALSDRMDRRMLVSLCSIVGAAGLLFLAQATALWGFALASGLMSISTAAGTPLMLALAADLVSPAARNWGLSLCTSAIWVAGIVGFAVAGRLLDSWATGPLATGAALLALLTALLPLLGTIWRRNIKPVAAVAT